jgi:uncharacterized protein (DUF1778 family)
MSHIAKVERFEARIRPEDKRTLERAAALSGRKLSDFVMSAARSAARKMIRRYDGMVLTDSRDREAFVNAMLAPPAPNAKLRAAAARYLEATKDHP